MKKLQKQFHLRGNKVTTQARKKLREEIQRRQEEPPLPALPAPKPGAKMSDDTVYAGSINGEALYVAPFDAPKTMRQKNAAAYVEEINRHKYLGFSDWELPSCEEVEILCKVQNEGDFAGTFNAKARSPINWYWTREVIGGEIAYNKCFFDGEVRTDGIDSSIASIRMIRRGGNSHA